MRQFFLFSVFKSGFGAFCSCHAAPVFLSAQAPVRIRTYTEQNGQDRNMDLHRRYGPTLRTSRLRATFPIFFIGLLIITVWLEKAEAQKTDVRL